jgi:glycosyltransferase involved in cell wall biosynthesis
MAQHTSIMPQARQTREAGHTAPTEPSRGVLLISYHFPPCTSIGMQRTLRFARHLPLFGWRPVILTVREHDFIGDPVEKDWQHRVPTAVPVCRARVLRPLETALRLRGLWQRVRMQSASMPPAQHSTLPDGAGSAPQSWVQRWVDPWFTTPDAHIGWLPFAVWRGLRVLWAEHIDMLYSSGPPYTSHLIGLGLKWLTRRSWVVDFRDPWSRRPWDTDTVRQGVRYRIQVWLERLVVCHADAVISNTERMGQDFRERYAWLPAEKFLVITNGYDVENFHDLPSTDGPPCDVFTLTHAGALYGRRDPRPLIQAIALLRDRGIITPGTFRLQLVGKLAAAWQVASLLASLNLTEYVALIPPVPHAESLTYLRRSHVLILLQPDAPLQVPGKLFEYIYLQKPILALAGAGSTADLVQQHGLGKVVAPENCAEIAAAVGAMYQAFQQGQLGTQGNAAALHCFHGQALTKRLADVFSTVKA